MNPQRRREYFSLSPTLSSSEKHKTLFCFLYVTEKKQKANQKANCDDRETPKTPGATSLLRNQACWAKCSSLLRKPPRCIQLGFLLFAPLLFSGMGKSPSFTDTISMVWWKTDRPPDILV
jgi:hypothetical protein